MNENVKEAEEKEEQKEKNIYFYKIDPINSLLIVTKWTLAL